MTPSFFNRFRRWQDRYEDQMRRFRNGALDRVRLQPFVSKPSEQQ